MPENIQITDGNFSLGPQTGFFYTIDFANKLLRQVEADGTVAATFFLTLSQLRNPVTELHFDGTFFWSLEDLPSNLGVVIKKWRLFPLPSVLFPNNSPSELRWQDEVTLINKTDIIRSSKAFAVEHFHRIFSDIITQGSNFITINDISNLSVGQTLNLGPSTATGFVSTGGIGFEESIVVTGIVTIGASNRVFFSKPGGLKNTYNNGNPINFTRALWVFNDHFLSGDEDDRGLLQRILYPSQQIDIADGGAQYSKVTAADFDSTKLVFVRTDQIIQAEVITPPFNFDSSLECNVRQSDKQTLIEVFDLIADITVNKQFFKLQQRELNTLGNDVVYSSGRFSFQNVSNQRFVNSISFSSDTRFTRTSASSDDIDIAVQVRDQFNFGVLGESINFSAVLNQDSDPGSPGTFSAGTALTNASGIAEVTYFPSATTDEILVDVQAQVVGAISAIDTVTALVVQIGEIENGKIPDTSRPVEQIAPLDKSSEPLEQKGEIIENPEIIEQSGSVTFPSIQSPTAAIIEQKDAKTRADTDGLIEQQEFIFSPDIIEQFDKQFIFKSIEQQLCDSEGAFTCVAVILKDAKITITQFNFIEDIFPECGSVKNPVTTNILWRIQDAGDAFDPATIEFSVNGRFVQNDPEFVVEVIPNGLQLFYDPPVDFPFNTEIPVFLRLSDTASPQVTYFLNCRWRTVPDTKPPVFLNIEPECDSTDVSVTAPIEFDVVDLGSGPGSGVDPDSIRITLEGIAVCSGVFLDPITVGSGSGFHVIYEHGDDPFRFGSNITLGLVAADNSAARNSSQFICCFSTAESTPPTFLNFDPEQCETFVDTITGLKFEVYGVEQGVDISTLEVRVDNQERVVIVRPRLLRAG